MMRQVLRGENNQLMQLELRQQIEEGFDAIEDIFKNTTEDNYKIILPEITNIITKENFETDSEKLKQGLEFTIKNHLGQYRDSGLPYAVHPIQTAYFMATLNRPHETIISALLHDVLEDNKPKEQELSQNIQKTFGYKVLQTVKALTTHEENRETRDTNHAKKIIKQAKHDGTHEILYIKTGDAITNLYTKKDMQPKNGLTAKERQQVYAQNIQKNILPFARYLDRQDEQTLRFVKYINDLVAR